MGSKKTKEKVLIGWVEHVDFPEWEIKGLRAKIDTGARTSALHVEKLEKLPNNQLRFEVVLSRENPKKRVRVCAPLLKTARVRSSTGHFTLRYFVKTRVRIGPVSKEIEFSLVSRETMLFRMLLGRRALEKDFLIDVSKRELLNEDKPPKRIKP